MIKRIFTDRLCYLFIFIALAVWCLFHFQFFINNNNIAPTLIALFVGLCSRIYSIYENKQLLDCKNTKIKRVLIDRDDAKEYGDKINMCMNTLDVMGHTARRLLEDFADIESSRNDKKQLIRALERGVKIKVLIADKDFLSVGKQKDFDVVLDKLHKLKKVSESFSGEIECRYYQHAPSHSIFKFDNECFLGPIFEEIESQHTPVIHFDNSSEYAVKYIRHFEQEWKEAICK